MRQGVQSWAVRGVVALVVVWVAWDAARATFGVVSALWDAPPAGRDLNSTVFLLANGLVPALAMVACAVLSAALVYRYPERQVAQSLALFCASVAGLFSLVLLPTLFASLRAVGVPTLPALPFSLPAEAALFLLGGLMFSWFFWFTASFPDKPVLTPTAGWLQSLSNVQRVAFRTPLVLIAGAIPLGRALGGRGVGHPSRTPGELCPWDRQLVD